MMECRNIGMLGLEDWENGEYKDELLIVNCELLIVNCELLIVNGICVLRTNFKRLRRKKEKPVVYSTLPLFHHSIIPVMVWKNASLEIPYYQQFVEIPLH